MQRRVTMSVKMGDHWVRRVTMSVEMGALRGSIPYTE